MGELTPPRSMPPQTGPTTSDLLSTQPTMMESLTTSLNTSGPPQLTTMFQLSLMMDTHTTTHSLTEMDATHMREPSTTTDMKEMFTSMTMVMKLNTTPSTLVARTLTMILHTKNILNTTH